MSDYQGATAGSGCGRKDSSLKESSAESNFTCLKMPKINKFTVLITIHEYNKDIQRQNIIIYFVC